MAGVAVQCQCGSQFLVPAPPKVFTQEDFWNSELGDKPVSQAYGSGAVQTEEERSPLSALSATGHLPGYENHGGGSGVGMWRQGEVLIMSHHARLPAICVKTGEHSAGYVPVELTWQPFWMYLIVPIGGKLLYWILADQYRKKATIHIGLSAAAAQFRSTATTLAIVVGVIGFLLIAGGIVGTLALQTAAMAIILCPLGGIALMAAALAGNKVSKVVSVQKITDHNIHLSGVHPNLLAMLPEWQGGRRR